MKNKPKEQINPADATRLAMAQELIWWYESGGTRPLPKKPTHRAYAAVNEEYQISDEIPSKYTLQGEQ